jgi:hypothetical protein
LYDFEFKLYDALSSGSPVGGTVTQGDVTVTNGLFTVQLDFGNVFDGTALYLEIGVRPGASVGAYTALAPRQHLSATPYAMYALQSYNADLLDDVQGNLYERAYMEGTVIAGTTQIIEIPNWYPFTLQLASGWPDSGGVAFVTGMENDRNIAITYVAYNGDGTSQYGGAECYEASNTVLLTFGNGSYTYQLKCPNEAAGLHNLVLTASGVELRYKVIY